MSQDIDLGGNNLIVDGLKVGATGPGQAGTSLTGTEITYIDAITPGTAAASKALILNSSSGITTGLTLLTATTVTATTVNATTGNITAVVSPTNLTLNATSTGTIGIGSVSTGAVTITPATTITGALTVTGVATFNSNPTFGAGKTIDLDSTPLTLTSNAVTATKYAGVITSESLTTAAGASQAFVITLSGVAAGDIAMITRAGGTTTRKNLSLEAVTSSNTLTVTLYNNEPTNAINGTVIFNYWVLKA